MTKRDAILKEQQAATIDSLQQVSDTLWMVNYQYPYGLGAMLRRGARGMGGIISFIQKQARHPAAVPSPAVGGFGCSTFNIRTPDGDVLMGRNFDYKDSLCIVAWTSPAHGYRSLMVTAGMFLLYGKKWQNLKTQRHPLRLMGLPYVCMDGINEMGLAAAIREIKAKATKQTTGKTPITPPVALRAVLDTCKDVDEAVALLKRYDMRDLLFVNYHYQFTDAAGNSAIVEYVDNKMHVIRQSAPQESLTLTNFFLTEGGDNRREMGRSRFENIAACVKEKGVLTEDAAMDLLHKNSMYRPHDWMPHMVATVWSGVYNCTARTVLLCAGLDYQKRFRFTLDRPGVCERVQ